MSDTTGGDVEPVGGSELVVERAALAETLVRPVTLTPPDGGVLLAVERFGLTTNNVTYAVTGDELGYWQFFPTAGDEHGMVPAWGVAEVVVSAHTDVDVGERWYGYVPMASHLVVQPGEVSRTEVVDDSPHRRELAGTYQRYTRLATDALHDESTLDLELLYRPLFTTAFLLAEVVAGAADDPYDVVVVTSASSKTGVALAHLLRERDATVVGVTSTANVAHVTATGLHDRVLAYDELEGLGDLAGRAVVVDLAGRRDVVADVHAALPDGLVEHLVVGVTHHDAVGRSPTSPADGPERTFFFAPTHAATLARTWGPAVLVERIADAWRPFVTDVAADLEVVELDGLGAEAAAWPRLVAGEVDPSVGLVVALD